jgi:hypothetical protein
LTIQDLLNAGVPSDAELSVMAFDWYPKTPLTVPYVVDANTGSTANIKSPLLVVFAGPNSFNRYDNTGYEFTQQYVRL